MKRLLDWFLPTKPAAPACAACGNPEVPADHTSHDGRRLCDECVRVCAGCDRRFSPDEVAPAGNPDIREALLDHEVLCAECDDGAYFDTDTDVLAGAPTVHRRVLRFPR